MPKSRVSSFKARKTSAIYWKKLFKTRTMNTEST